jgi:hypothetical protein
MIEAVNGKRPFLKMPFFRNPSQTFQAMPLPVIQICIFYLCLPITKTLETKKAGYLA